MKEKEADVEDVGLAGFDVMLGAAGGVASTVQPAEEEGPVLPAVSVWRTSNVCAPSPRDVYVSGLVHAVNAPPSSRHAKDPPGSPVKEKDAEVEFVGSLGPAVIVGAAGAVVSIVQV